MGNVLCMLDLARELAEIASETRDPDTAARLIELVNEMLTAADLPSAGGAGSNGGNEETH